MTLEGFIKNYTGKAIDYDGSAGAQCVDLIKMYLDYVLGITPKAIGNAHAYFDNFESHDFLTKNFVKISNSKKFVPMKGDICVWSKALNGYGHVSIATGNGNTSSFETFDMNWGGKNAKLVTHNYSRFSGVLRPKNRKNIDGAQLYRTAKAVNIRSGAGTNFKRLSFNEFDEYEQEQVTANGGSAADNDFPKNMLVTVYEKKSGFGKISDKKSKWLSLNFCRKV